MTFKHGGEPWNKGKLLSEETKKKISIACLGRPSWNTGKHLSEETKAKIRAYHLGRPLSKEHKKKIGLSRIGKHHTEEAKLKIGAFHKGKQWALGKKFSEETKRRMSLAQMGNTKLLGFWNGRKHKLETKLKISKLRKGNPKYCGVNHSFYGVHHTEESKEKMSKAALTRDYTFEDTSIEVKLQEALRKRGVKFVTHYKITGRPDIAIPEKRVVIFADGDYFHANPKLYTQDSIIKGKYASDIWEHDAQVTKQLQTEGWCVRRYWESEINANVDAIATGLTKVLSILPLNKEIC